MNTQDPVVLQLKKSLGQIQGIQRMYEEGRECSEIVQQLIAVRAGISRVARMILSQESVRCLRGKGQEEKLAKTIETLLKI